MYPMFLTLLLNYNQELVSANPIVKNVFFLLALLFYVVTCFDSGRLNRHIVVRISLLVALIPTFLITKQWGYLYRVNFCKIYTDSARLSG